MARKSSSAPPWQKAIVVLEYTVLAVVVIAALYWAQVVFIPVALALFLTFLLTPLVRRLQKRGVGRLPAVGGTVLLVALLLGALTWLIGLQLTGLLTDLPTYSANIKAKARTLRELGAGSFTKRIEDLMTEVGEELKQKPPLSGKEQGALPQPVVIKPDTPNWIGRLPSYLGSTIELLAGLALVLVLVVFLLLNREDMRNRLVRLAGERRLSFTTQALAEASERITRYLLMQLIVNASFGAALAIGLLVIGVDYALLWGFLAAVLRYIPYVGPWIAAVFPIGLSLAMFEGWWQPFAVVGLVLVLELVSNNFMEPRLYGHSIGVSEVGLLVCAAFWTFLWGPIGLLLSAPLTVCLVVLGKYVPQLKCIDILLGDKPVLPPDVWFYQRLLARDVEEAKELVRKRLTEPQPEKVYDELYLPALHRACFAHKRGDLSAEDERAVVETIRAFLRELHSGPGLSPEPVEHPGPIEPASDEPKVRLMACAARNREDEPPLAMLRTLLDPKRWDVEMVSADTLTGETVERADDSEPEAILIGCVPPGITYARYLCKRLRARFPDLKILVGYWGDGRDERTHQRLRDAGADEVLSGLLEARDRLNGLTPMLSDAAVQRT